MHIDIIRWMCVYTYIYIYILYMQCYIYILYLLLYIYTIYIYIHIYSSIYSAFLGAPKSIGCSRALSKCNPAERLPSPILVVELQVDTNVSSRNPAWSFDKRDATRNGVLQTFRCNTEKKKRVWPLHCKNELYKLYMAVCQNLVPLVNIEIAGK